MLSYKLSASHCFTFLHLYNQKKHTACYWVSFVNENLAKCIYQSSSQIKTIMLCSQIYK